MPRYEIQVVNEKNEILASSTERSCLEEEVYLYYEKEYQKGDFIRIIPKTKEPKEHVFISFDETLEKSLVYITGEVCYFVPFEDKATNLSPKAFTGKAHLISVKRAKEYEWKSYRNLALNPCDQHSIAHLYPHAYANVETRGEADFAAQNAINGITYVTSHGNWPYGSWGINKQSDAELTIDFGREVVLDAIAIYERGDFPHDNYWIKATITCSDGSKKTIELKKSIEPQNVSMDGIKTKTITISNLIMSNEVSKFPALSQIEAYGVDIEL